MYSHPALHNFSDNGDSIPFKILPLELSGNYDNTVPHRHNYFEIFFFTQGGGTHFIDFNNYKISSNSIHFVLPGQIHCVRREKGSFGSVILFSSDFYHLHFKMNDILSEFYFSKNTPVISLTDLEFSAYLPLLDALGTEYTSSDPLKENIICSYLNIILVNCKRKLEDTPGNSSLENSTYHDIFRKFRILIENHYMELHLPSDYANLLNITEKHLNEISRQISGQTASTPIHERIILEVKRLLFHSDISFKEIGYALHFEDPSYFSRFFKRFAGTTPSEFRIEIRKKYQI
jgi:AraC family transcriptional regulator, transcriptional activator of pobA